MLYLIGSLRAPLAAHESKKIQFAPVPLPSNTRASSAARKRRQGSPNWDEPGRQTARHTV